MVEKRKTQSEGRIERRRHPRAETSARYRRLRAEIEPPAGFADAGRLALGWLARIRLRARLWRYRNRKAAA